MISSAVTEPLGAVAVAEPVAQLRNVRRLVAEGLASDEPLTLAALYLIDCAADMVGCLEDGDLESARDALGSARAAVVSATYAVRRIHDLSRMEQGERMV
ncbi:hypothetical protein [Streptosporangium sp. NPDC051022]|uniref:hypothetical protein n=1 Tax=Streptosporangium sp. NPDC051022 TaxID=3155752 RepID=UPI00342764F7